MDSRPIITVKAHARPVLLYRCLSALEKCWGIEKYPVVISVDLLDSIPMKEQTLTAVEQSNIANKCGEVEIVWHDQRLGCPGNAQYCLSRGFESGAPYTIHLEDDILFAPDCLSYLEWTVKRLDGGNYFAACTYNRPCHQKTAPHSADIVKTASKKLFDGSGGLAMTSARWRKIQAMGGMFGVNYISDAGRKFDCRGTEWLSEIRKQNLPDPTSLSWVWPFDKFFSQEDNIHLPSVYPIVNRSLNIGKRGLHVKSEQEHSQLQYNQHWTGGAYEPINQFLDEITIDNNKYIEDGIEHVDPT